jgi:3-oxoacyl-[acyl-carrier protein] reductase
LGIGSSVPYIASKGALNAITKYFARELAPEIRVNAVCPGLVTSRWFADGVGVVAYEKLKTSYENGVPLRIACSCEDVADAVIWLADRARTTTGELLLLDSGIHLA